MPNSHAQPRVRRRHWLIGLATLSTCLLASLGFSGAASAASDPTITIAYDASGSTTIGSVNTTVPIAPTTLTATLDLNTFQIINGSLPIAPQTITFNALGFIPMRATVSLIETSPVTGTITPNAVDDDISSTVSYTVKLSNISVDTLGVWIPLFVGPNCQTINPVNISVSNPAGQNFDVFNGGTVTGKYTIGNFQNCAPLNLPDIFGIGSLPVNALVPGTNNTVTLNISNGVFVSSTP